jgi:hypothetical protein
MMAAVEKLRDAAASGGFISTDVHMQYCAKVIRGLMDNGRLPSTGRRCSLNSRYRCGHEPRRDR